MAKYISKKGSFKMGKKVLRKGGKSVKSSRGLTGRRYAKK